MSTNGPQPSDATSPLPWLSQRSVFTFTEWRDWYTSNGGTDATAHTVLQYHVRTRRLFHVRRGLYTKPETVEPVLLASKITDDAIISHDGALAFHGLTGMGHGCTFLTARRLDSFCLNEVVYRPLRLDRTQLDQLHPERHEREGTSIRVVRVEHALVDCLDRLSCAPLLDHLLTAFTRLPQTASIQELIAYTLTKKNRLLCARVGLFLMCTLNGRVRDDQLLPLERNGLRRPAYFHRPERSPGDGVIARWNLIVPNALSSAWAALLH